MGPPNNEKNRVAVNIFVLLGTLLFLAIITEIASRLIFPQWPYFWSQGFLRHDPELGTYVGKPNYRGRLSNIYNEFNIPVALNRDGFRNSETAQPKKAKLLCFGDSFGFGWGVPAEKVLCAAAAKKLQIPYYNFSMPATDLTDYLLLARKNSDILSDRIISVLVTYENDVLSYPPPEKISANRLQPKVNRIFKWMIENSAFWSVLTSVLQQSNFFVMISRRLGFLAPSGAAIDGNRDPVASSVEILDAFRRLAAGALRFIVIVVPPRPGMDLENRYTEFLRRLKESKFETVFPKYRDDDFFPKDGHWTPAAHERTGRLLTERIKQGK